MEEFVIRLVYWHESLSGDDFLATFAFDPSEILADGAIGVRLTDGVDVERAGDRVCLVLDIGDRWLDGLATFFGTDGEPADCVVLVAHAAVSDSRRGGGAKFDDTLRTISGAGARLVFDPFSLSVFAENRLLEVTVGTRAIRTPHALDFRVGSANLVPVVDRAASCPDFFEFGDRDGLYRVARVHEDRDAIEANDMLDRLGAVVGGLDFLSLRFFDLAARVGDFCRFIDQRLESGAGAFPLDR